MTIWPTLAGPNHPQVEWAVCQGHVGWAQSHASVRFTIARMERTTVVLKIGYWLTLPAWQRGKRDGKNNRSIGGRQKQCRCIRQLGRELHGPPPSLRTRNSQWSEASREGGHLASSHSGECLAICIAKSPPVTRLGVGGGGGGTTNELKRLTWPSCTTECSMKEVTSVGVIPRE